MREKPSMSENTQLDTTGSDLRLRTFSEWLRILLTGFFANIKFIVIVPILAALLTFVLCKLSPPIYEGRFSVLIKAPEFDQSAIPTETSIVMRPGLIMDNLKSNELYILKSPALYTKIAENLTVDKRFVNTSFLSELIDEKTGNTVAIGTAIEKLCDVEQLMATDIIEIRAKHRDASLIQAILDMYAESYFAFRKNIWINKKTAPLLASRSQHFFNAWKNAMEDLTQFKETIKMVDPARERAKLEEQLVNYRAEILELNTSLSYLYGQKKVLRTLSQDSTINFIPEVTEKDNLFREMKVRIGRTKMEKTAALQNFMPGSEPIRKIDYQLNAMYKEYRDLLINHFDHQIEEQQERLTSIEDAIKTNMTKLAESNRYEAELKVKVEATDFNLRQYKQQQDEQFNEKHNRELKQIVGNVSIVTSPFVNTENPVWPKTPVLIMISAFITLFLSLIYTFVRVLVSDSFYLPEEVTRELDLPVLASFAYESGKKKKRS